MANLSMLGVAIGDPNDPSCANPTSSRTITATLGAPVGGRLYGTNCSVASLIRRTVGLGLLVMCPPAIRIRMLSNGPHPR